MKNYKLPNFKKIKLDSIEPSLDEILSNNRKKLHKLLKQGKTFTWKSLIKPLEDMDDNLGQMWSSVRHLHSVKDSKKLREVYNRCLPKLSEYCTNLNQDVDLYKAIKSIRIKNLDSAQKKVIKDKIRDFKLSGVALKPSQKKRFKELVKAGERLSTKFEENILDATHEWSFLIKDEVKLSGLPDYTKASIKQAAKEKNLDGYLLTLDFPIYNAVMTHCDDAGIREIMYEAYVTRASDKGPNAKLYDNTLIMDELLSIRHEIAELLRFKNFAKYSLETKMAKDTNEVLEFLNNLVKRVKPIASREFKALKDFAKQEFGVNKINVWDISYYSEKLKHKLFNISQKKIRPFLPEKKVIKGMFDLVEILYDIKIKEIKKVDVWNKCVKFFEISDKNGVRGGFYVDLYAREHKRSGAWMDECIVRRRLKNGKIQIPIAFLTCNFTKPTSKKPSLLTSSEILALFHEFGHCLHHLLTKVDYYDVSGINGVEWDAVELPSQFMENFFYQKEVINLISSHYKTKKPLPKKMLNNLIRSKNFQAGMKMMRQLEFGLFDFRIHLEFGKSKKSQIQNILDDVRKRVSVLKVPKYNRFQHGFSHIFDGSYSAGYYSYKWAEVLSSDAFSKFEEEGVLNKKTAQSFLHNILEQGGSSEMMKLFVKFRGRKPVIDAMVNEILY